MQQADEEDALRTILIEEQVIGKRLDGPPADTLGVAESRLGAQLRMRGNQNQRALHGVTKPFRGVRIDRAQLGDDLRVVGKKARSLVQVSGHAPASQWRA